MSLARRVVETLLLLGVFAINATATAALPQVMLVLGKDEPWFHDAYPPTVDVDGDGAFDPTYRDAIEYAGYFHPRRCYRYQDVPPNAAAVFAVVAVAAGAHGHYCDGAADDAWSGNFLNWATMTRMDLLRQALYGGFRAAIANGDTATGTVLERAHLPADGHAFVKYYNGADLARLVPFTALKVDAANGGDNDGIDDPDEGISLCNVSYKASGSSQGAGTSTPVETPNPAPMLRVVRENFQLWDANERYQCTWANEGGSNANANLAATSGVFAAGIDPAVSKELRTPGGSRDHLVRVQACEPAFFDVDDNPERCTAYGGNLKPEGLLQQRGLRGDVRFGLLTTSYLKNLSGGVLRKRVDVLTDEVDPANGRFIVRTGEEPGIIRTLNAMRVFGYRYDDGTYAAGEDCPFQLTELSDGRCRSWGNPVSELYLEALRYFALGTARAPTLSFAANDASAIAGMVSDDWSIDPLPSTGAATAWNVVMLNAAPSSFDDDQTNLMSAAIGDVNESTNAVGAGEGLHGATIQIGRVGNTGDEFCTPKLLDELAAARGPCPAQPTQRGSYHVAGLAYRAWREDLRPADAGRQVLRTFAVELAYRPATITVPVGNATVQITPAYRLRRGGNQLNEGANQPQQDGGGALLRLAPVIPHREVASATDTRPQSGTGHYHAKYLLVWDDTEQGADFDQDMWGTLEYALDTNVNPPTLRVTSHAVRESTATAQLFGFVVQGTTQDGFHAYSGIDGAHYFANAGVDASGVPGCNGCRAANESTGQRGPRSHVFTIGAGAATALQPPLFYASKWGGFDDQDGDGQPLLLAEWDARDQLGEPASDGIPDTYFPLRAASGLRAALDTIAERIVADACTDCTGDHDGDGLDDGVDPDDDNDGMPDEWETGFGLNPLDAGDAALDFDGDGGSNLAEFEAGTDPVVPFDPPADASAFDFEDATLLGLTPADGSLNGMPVPAAALLNDAYADRGLRGSGVGVVVGGAGYAASGMFMLAGVSNGAIDYAAPFTLQFVSPADGTSPAVTSYFAIRTDRSGGSGNSVRISAYDVHGTLLATQTRVEAAGTTAVELNGIGPIHSVMVQPLVADPANGGIGFDDVVMGSLSVVPAVPAQLVPALSAVQLALLALGMLGMGARRLGRRSRPR